MVPHLYWLHHVIFSNDDFAIWSILQYAFRNCVDLEFIFGLQIARPHSNDSRSFNLMEARTFGVEFVFLVSHVTSIELVSMLYAAKITIGTSFEIQIEFHKPQFKIMLPPAQYIYILSTREFAQNNFSKLNLFCRLSENFNSNWHFRIPS